MGWTLADLSTRAGQVLARGNPSSYLLPSQGTRHAFVLEHSATSPAINAAIVEWVTQDDQSYAANGLQIGVDGAPLAQGHPASYVFHHENSQHVLYAGQNDFGHIQELWWDGDWHHNELTAAAHAPIAASNANGYDFDTGSKATQHVVYRGNDGHVHELARLSGGWRHFDLTSSAGGPSSAAEPFGYGFGAQGTQHVIYRGVDGNGGALHELWWDTSGWHHEPLSEQTGAPAAGSEPFGYVFGHEGTQHVDYVGTDRHVYELWWDATGWHVEDLTARTGAPLAQGSAGVRAYPFEPARAVPDPTQHVLYRGADDHIHELWWDPTGWHHSDLHDVPGSPLAGGDPTGFANPGDGTQHVYYVSADHHFIALTWTP